MTRKPLTLTEKLASALLSMTDGNGTPLVDREKAKHMSAGEIVSMFEFDHGVHVAIGGSNHPTNVTPRITAEHRGKTAAVDIPQIAKTKRIKRANDEFVNRLLRKTGADVPQRSNGSMPSRPFPKKQNPWGYR